jgi:hypothetical protein
MSMWQMSFMVALLAALPAAQAAQPATVPAPAPLSARAAAPVDLTGYWVSLVTQNWQFRMVVPMKGDYGGIPINRKAKDQADAWSAAADEAAGLACKAYGAGNIMRIPGRLHMSWPDEQTLQVEVDAGKQTRVLHFVPAGREAPDDGKGPSWQGRTAARWENPATARNPAVPGGSGSLELHTDQLLPGLLRKNGVPYGVQARLTEYWETSNEGGDTWLTVTTVLDDPEYLRGSYIINSIYRKERDGSRWNPSDCTLKQ